MSQPPSPPAAAPGRALGGLEVPPHPHRTIWGCMSEAQLTAGLRIPRCQRGCWRWERSRNAFSQERRAEEKVNVSERGLSRERNLLEESPPCSGCPGPVPAAPRGQQLLKAASPVLTALRCGCHGDIKNK